MKEQSKSNTKRTLASFWRFTRQDKLFFVLGTGFAALGTIIQDVLPPFIVAQAFDKLQKIYSGPNSVSLSDFSSYLLLYTALIVSAIFIWRIQVIFVWIYELRAVKRIMEFLFDHIQNQDTKFHADRFGGSLVSQANKYASAYERVMDEFTWSITTGVVAFAASLVLLFITIPFYAVILLLVCIVYMTIIFWRMKVQFPLDRKLSSSESDRTAKLADMITNVGTVKAFAGEDYENKLFAKQTAKTHQAFKNLLKMHLINDTISHSGTALINILSFTIGIIAITNFSAPVGALFLAVNYTMSLSRRLWEFSRVLRNLNRSFGDANDMVEILNIKSSVQDPVRPEKPKIARGGIRLENVTFSHPENDDALFNDLSLSIKPGEKVGLVGHSGSGKTTLTKLLLRFSDIDSGNITIDGQNIRKIKQSDLRRNITYVPQEPMLFHRSLAENIGYGEPNADLRQIKAVAKMAHADDFIENLSDGYNTLVGERGVKLSGGQRQRVAIARALIKNAPILILDEATSALDSESEVLIQNALWKLMEGRTAIVIAHRLSTIQKMDRIIVLENGDIVEQGTHKELIRQNGTYAGLWDHQSGGFMND